MNGVKWIKIVTDIFDDEKIQLIEAMPEADAIIVIWFKLLCLAGRCNAGGSLMMSDRIAYTDAMLATIFRRKTAKYNMVKLMPARNWKRMEIYSIVGELKYTVESLWVEKPPVAVVVMA